MVNAGAFLDVFGIVGEVGNRKAFLEHCKIVGRRFGDSYPAPRLPLMDLAESILAFQITNHNLVPSCLIMQR